MHQFPILGICSLASGMGKTTLLARLIPFLGDQGIRVSVIKQTHAQFDVDHPGKDSYRMREAGAAQVLLSSPNRWALMTEETLGESDDRLMQMVRHLDGSMADLVLVEGFRHAPIPKIEVYRANCGKPPLAGQDEHVIAIASDMPVLLQKNRLDLNHPEEIGRFILHWLSEKQELRENALPAISSSK